MKYLIKSNEKKEKIVMLIGQTSIKSKNIQNAIIDYYCGDSNKTKRATALLNDVEESNLCRDMKKVNVEAGKLERLKELDWPEYKAFLEYKKTKH
jgi:hypothetical protein